MTNKLTHILTLSTGIEIDGKKETEVKAMKTEYGFWVQEIGLYIDARSIKAQKEIR